MFWVGNCECNKERGFKNKLYITTVYRTREATTYIERCSQSIFNIVYMCPQKLINVNGLSIGFDQMSFDWIDGLIDGAVGRLAAGATMQQCLAVHEIPLCQIYLPSPLSPHKAPYFIYIFSSSFSYSFTCQ